MLKDKVALITGASRGIGKATVKVFLKNGAKVYGVSRSEEALKKLKEEFGEGFEYFVADVSDYERAKEVVDEIVRAEGRIDVLVNNAGITADSLFVRMDEEKWRKVIDVNLGGVYNYSSAAIKHMMKQRSGVIVNVSSIVGIYGNAGQTNYAASKAAILGFTKSLAKEVGRRGIRVVAVAPGFIETSMTENIPEKIKNAALNATALGRFGKAEEVANVILFLSSDLASYITGTVVEVSGGLVI